MFYYHSVSEIWPDKRDRRVLIRNRLLYGYGGKVKCTGLPDEIPCLGLVPGGECQPRLEITVVRFGPTKTSLAPPAFY